MKNTNRHILEFLEEWAPQSTKLEYDNVGLLVGNSEQEPRKVLVTLDVTDEVVEEAIQKQAHLIIAHHPLIFRKLSRITEDDAVGSLIYRLVKNDISLIAAHTNLDAAYGGVSFVLAEKLGLREIEFLKPSGSDNSERPSNVSEESGFGAIGTLEQPMAADVFLRHVAQTLNVRGLRYSGFSDTISKVAVCGGSGVFLTDEAVKKGAHAYVTADIKYHEFFYGSSSFLLVDAGHYESEVPVIGALCDRLSGRFPDIEVIASGVNTNPVNYLTVNPN
ncbi:Nif3-like dinuclear metal center hexameric protein [Balneolaceae bacterium ANBcel3]|nr:Nif3-like dinuclear metal center hexameric protein [Balneolaceae bacterium ANBcel3]